MVSSDDKLDAVSVPVDEERSPFSLSERIGVLVDVEVTPEREGVNVERVARASKEVDDDVAVESAEESVIFGEMTRLFAFRNGDNGVDPAGVVVWSLTRGTEVADEVSSERPSFSLFEECRSLLGDSFGDSGGVVTRVAMLRLRLF